jgi:hypothetical protein
VSCYEGTRTCVGGVLGECTDGYGFELERTADDKAAGAGLRPLAFSTATDCTNNPCNSYCREFNEAPPAGLVPKLDESAPPLSSWLTGNASDYPPEWRVIGTREPCQVAGDCQFNTACTDPARGSCTHSVCGEGETLAPGCNRCADAVCTINADCCAVAPECAHDPCEVGNFAPLDPECDTCVAAICDKHPECCDQDAGLWNEACVGYVATECAPLGQSCTCPEGSRDVNGTCYSVGADEGAWFYARDACAAHGAGWSLLTINDEAENAMAQSLLNGERFESAWIGGFETGTDEWSWQSTSEPFFRSDASGGEIVAPFTYVNWAPQEPQLNRSDLAVTFGEDGFWSDAPFGFEQPYLCEGPKNQLGPRQSPFKWDGACVELAERTCGVSCPDSTPLGLGECTPRAPTELDDTCPGFDLALGATCEDAGVPQIPVCNHGQTEAPAGMHLSQLPIGQLGSVAPVMTLATDCVLTEPVPAGRCVTLTDCPGLVADMALLVNPPGATQDGTECRKDDNWTIYQPLSCKAAVCESGVFQADQLRTNRCSIELQNPLGVDPDQARVRVGTSVPEPTCGRNEVRWGTSCYFFSPTFAIWDRAQERCRERGPGWDLVAINSPAENTWVRSNTDPNRDLQIGFNDKDTEGDHAWSNGSCNTFTDWDDATSQPNNTPPGSEQCVRMTVDSGRDWEDTVCSDGDHPYACEGPMIDARGGCAAGQIAGPDGKCYAFERGGRSFAAAQSGCLGIGPGWQLAVIDDVATNDFVTSLVSCTPTWINNPPGALGNWKPAESVDLSKDPYIDAEGFWHATDDGVERGTVCQGPLTATGAPELAQVASVADCQTSDQYYFVGNETAPESLVLCPDTCVAAAAVPGRRVEIEIPCLPPAPPALETESVLLYDPQCAGSIPQWDFLYYDAVTPADSRVEFEVRTAATQDELDANLTSYLPVATAHAVPTDTQRCEGVSQPGCPIDIFHALEADERLTQLPLLQLRIRLVPGSNGEGPILRDWKVRFSCPPTQ